jgi:hypothetical protein
MLIPVINFELMGKRFTVEDTEDNLALISHHPLTRQLKFDQVFDWQMPRLTANEPKFIQFGNEVLSALDGLSDATEWEQSSDNEDVMA